jgi:hypothetical protein
MTHASLHALSENDRLRDRCSGRLSVTCASGLSSDRKLGALRAHGVGALYAHRRQRDLAAARLDVVLLDGAERIDDRPGQVSGFLEVIFGEHGFALLQRFLTSLKGQQPTQDRNGRNAN